MPRATAGSDVLEAPGAHLLPDLFGPRLCLGGEPALAPGHLALLGRVCMLGLAEGGLVARDPLWPDDPGQEVVEEPDPANNGAAEAGRRNTRVSRGKKSARLGVYHHRVTRRQRT